MTQKERDELKRLAEARKSDEFAEVHLMCDEVLDLLAENQRMRELLENAAYAMKHPSKTGRSVTLQLAALIESFLADPAKEKV